jgi:hypothetical protein
MLICTNTSDKPCRKYLLDDEDSIKTNLNEIKRENMNGINLTLGII